MSPNLPPAPVRGGLFRHALNLAPLSVRPSAVRNGLVPLTQAPGEPGTARPWTTAPPVTLPMFCAPLMAWAVIGRVAEAEGMLSENRTDVEVVIDRADVAEVLAAITGGSVISIIPAGAGS